MSKIKITKPQINIPRLIEKEVIFTNNRGLKLAGMLHLPRGKGPFPAIIHCHGFKRDKDQVLGIALCRNLQVNGVVALRFSFSGWGRSQGRYTDTNFTNKVNDALAAIKYLKKLKVVNNKRIGLSGLSMGGGVVMQVAGKHYTPKVLIAFAPMISGKRFVNTTFSQSAIKKANKIGFALYRDQARDIIWKFSKRFIENLSQVNILKNAKSINAPTEIILGNSDKVIRHSEAKKAITLIGDKKRFIIIPETDHWFRQIKGLEKAITEATSWCKKYL
ncbi:alpha/beta hydrolase [Patescibacteria group bacterium]